jgi:glutathione S-transferase
MEKALESGPWLMGAQYTIADIVVTPSIDRMADLGFSSIWDRKYPRVTAWYTRMQTRPAFQQAFYKGTRMSVTFKLSPAIVD